MKSRVLKYFSICLLVVVAVFFSSCRNDDVTYSSGKGLTKGLMVPKVLFITSGLSEENPNLPKGIVIALQAFNKEGAIVRLETRSALYDKDILNQYNILIVSTSSTYHDADRKYSLSFMSDDEMRNIADFVEKGGVLIAGDNIGRNLLDGTDRISLYQQLNRDNFVLSACLGVDLSERNMNGYGIYGELNEDLEGYFKDVYENDIWTLVPDTIHSSTAEVLGYWYNAKDSIPAIIKNSYGDGTSYLFPSSDFFHPASEGGTWSADNIMKFYSYVLNDFKSQNNIGLSLNPWPNGKNSAFCLSFNSEGSISEYKRLFKKIKKWDADPIFFVNGKDTKEIRDYLATKEVYLGSTGYSYRNYREFLYPDAVNDILSNEQSWEIDFNGFRFPFTKPSYWGLLALNENDYSYISSIGANNLEFFHGSVFPYNIVVSQNKYYKTTEILEVAPVYHDDYHFLKDVKSPEMSPRQLEKDIQLYSKYLVTYWNRAVKPYNGLMVYLGHPAYVAHNDSTLYALDTLIQVVKSDHSWITSMEDVVAYRKALAQFSFLLTRDAEGYKMMVSGPSGLKLEGVSFLLDDDLKISKVSSQIGKAELRSVDDKNVLIIDASDGEMIELY